jgi:hypothetical protein
MVVRILLLAGEDAAETVEISRTVVVDALRPEWRHDLVSAIGEHARDTARCLLEQIDPALPAPRSAGATFVPLAQLLPSCD